MTPTRPSRPGHRELLDRHVVVQRVVTVARVVVVATDQCEGVATTIRNRALTLTHDLLLVRVRDRTVAVVPVVLAFKLAVAQADLTRSPL